MDNERIPTMPQTEERIPTMPQTEERIPTMPQTEGRIPTMPQAGEGRIPTMPQAGEGRIATMPQQVAGEGGRLATIPQDSLRGSRRGNILLGSDIEFTGDKGGHFIIHSSEVINTDSGESQIYACNSSGRSEKLVARILLSVKPSDAVEKLQTREKVIRFLDSVSRNEDAHILPLLDYGSIKIKGAEYFVEIYPYCEDGDLGKKSGKLSYQEIKTEIVPAINEALHLFHSAGLVHRDIKPDNLYRYNGKIVIGDFGISCDLREDGFATDKFKTGTLGYYAPELMSQAAIQASDYYSFGQTLWTLYSGEMMYRNILRRYKDYGIEEQRNQVNFAMLSNVYYGLDEISKEDAFFEVLIRGLLQYDPTGRFDYEKVNRWLKDDRSVALEIAKYDNKSIYKNPFKFKGKDYWDNEEVHSALAEDCETAKELLYSGMLKNFFVSYDFGIASELDKIVKEYSKPKKGGKADAKSEILEIRNDVGLCKFLMLLNSANTLVWRNKEYKSFSDFSDFVAESIKKNGGFRFDKDFLSLLSSEAPELWYKDMALKADQYDKGMAKAIQNIRELASSNQEMMKKVAYTSAYYLFARDESAVKYKDCSNLEELASYLMKYKKNPFALLEEILQDPYFYGFLFAMGYMDHAWQMLNSRQGTDSIHDFEMFYDLLFGMKANKKLVTELKNFYIAWGPHSHLYWWRNNLNLYSYHSEEAKQIKAKVESFVINSNSLNDIRNSFAELDQLSIRFREMFVDNIFLAQMGLNKGKNGISSDRMEAYWHMNFLGQEAAIGFNQYIRKGA